MPSWSDLLNELGSLSEQAGIARLKQLQQEQLASIEAEQNAIERTLLDAPDNQPAQATFISSVSAPEARAKLIVNHETNSALILARDLPELSDQQYYVAWLRLASEDEYARDALLDLDDDGGANMTLEPRDASRR